jgi:hypothetical protein
VRGSRDSVFGMATGRRLDHPRFASRQMSELFPFCETSTPALLLTQAPVQLILRAFFSGVRWPDCKVDHSPPSSAETKYD